MRLHLLLAASFALLVAGTARAEHGDAAKSLESTQGASPRASKVRAPQASLFLEQKEAPGASKTTLRMDGAPRLSQKSKD